MNDVNRLRLLLCTKSSDKKLRKLPPTREALQLHILRSVYAAGCIWGVTLQPSDQIPSLVNWEWKYSQNNRFALDWCRAYNANLNDCKFTCICNGLCSRSKCQKKELLGQENKILLCGLLMHMPRRVQNPVKHLRLSFFCENSKQLKPVNN